MQKRRRRRPEGTGRAETVRSKVIEALKKARGQPLKSRALARRAGVSVKSSWTRVVLKALVREGLAVHGRGGYVIA